MMTVILLSAWLQTAPPCRVGAFDTLAFYAGTWRVTVAARLSARGPWEKTEGASTIAPDLEGCALVEHLDTTREGKALQLLSILTYDHNAARWQYAVADTAHGRLLTYQGRREGDVTSLFVDVDVPGGRVLMRRRLTRESDDAFTWESARSVDRGKTWDVTTRFAYRRATG